jgi:hypothetical protein
VTDKPSAEASETECMVKKQAATELIAAADLKALEVTVISCLGFANTSHCLPIMIAIWPLVQV